ncbi:MAG TPA: dihydroneopterin aldolase [Symbiobacteriaceae bacterium]|nr:dihydroneopterin aldolase [Symbiobacteriaceae bacterium]
MGDRIVLTGMRFYGYHGVYPEETRLGQTFLVDVELYADLQQAGRTDSLEFTVDYGKVYLAVKEIVEGRPFKLIEALAEKIAATVMEGFPVQAITVRVHKPQAPIPGAFDGVTVEIHRRRE